MKLRTSRPRGQAKLLRVIQQQEVRRLGETSSRKIDVRLVTAANRDMRAAVAAGHFRPDLLYRLDVIRIRIPPLRERPEDTAALAQHFWRVSAVRMSCGARLTRGVLSELASYHWPGNVRQLQNVMAALAVGAPRRGEVRRSMLPVDMTDSTGVAAAPLADARSVVRAAICRSGSGARRREPYTSGGGPGAFAAGPTQGDHEAPPRIALNDRTVRLSLVGDRIPVMRR